MNDSTSNPTPIDQLTPSQALQQAIKASELLLVEISQGFNQEINIETEPEEDVTLPKIEKLQKLRDQLIVQTFSHLWTEEEVQEHLAAFQKLEALDTQLQNAALNLRTNLHQLRTDNQQGRKAVSAYGTAKGQFHR